MYARVLYIRYIDVGMMGGCLSMCKPTVRIKVLCLYILYINLIVIVIVYIK